MIQTKKAICAILIALFFRLTLSAQFAVKIGNAEALKTGTTYVIINDPDSKDSKQYINIFRSYWTLSKVEFIDYGGIVNHLKPQSYFLTFAYSTKDAHDNNPKHLSINGKYPDKTKLYLYLWKIGDKYFEKERNIKEFENYMQDLAEIQLHVDAAFRAYPENVEKYPIHGGSHILNWSPGLLKNHLQQLIRLLKGDNERGKEEDVGFETPLKKLKMETLWIPDFNFKAYQISVSDGGVSGTSPTETKALDLIVAAKEIMADYKFPYKFIDSAELNKKILDAREPFYYLACTISGSDKYVNVMNGLTGEVIYSNYVALSETIQSKDLKKLSKTID